jgi:hypothetical protein
MDDVEEFEPDATEIGLEPWDYEIEPEHDPRDHNFIRDDEPTLDFGRCVDVD